MNTIKKMMSLSGKTALITGATGMVGQEAALTIAELGGDLILVDISGSDYSSIKERIVEKFNTNIECIDCDLESEKSRHNLIEKVNNRAGSLHILINNAAFVGESNLEGWIDDFEHQTIDTWRRAVEVNLTAVFHLSQGLVKSLSSSGYGVIINISSIYGMKGPDLSLYKGTDMGNPAAYAASKGGVIQLTQWLATVVAPDIRVNCISPGGIRRNQPNNFVQRYELKTPLGRMATEQDLKGVFTYLSSDLSAYVTGQNIVVDGGWTIW